MTDKSTTQVTRFDPRLRLLIQKVSNREAFRFFHQSTFRCIQLIIFLFLTTSLSAFADMDGTGNVITMNFFDRINSSTDKKDYGLMFKPIFYGDIYALPEFQEEKIEYLNMGIARKNSSNNFGAEFLLFKLSAMPFASDTDNRILGTAELTLLDINSLDIFSMRDDWLKFGTGIALPIYRTRTNFASAGAKADIGMSTVRVGTALFKHSEFAATSFGAPASMEVFLASRYKSFDFKIDSKCERFLSGSPYTSIEYGAEAGFRFFMFDDSAPGGKNPDTKILDYYGESALTIKYRKIKAFAGGASQEVQFIGLGFSMHVFGFKYFHV